MTTQTRSKSTEVKQTLSNLLKDGTNYNIICSGVLLKLLDSKEKFHEDLIAELKSQSHSVLKEISNSLKEIKELTITLANSRNEDLLCKLDQLNITLQKNNGHLYGDTNSKSNLKSDADYTAHFSKELND